MKNRIVTILLILIPIVHLWGQDRYLLLRKVGRPYQIVFYEGEEMRFRVKGEKKFIKDYIQGLKGDVIRFHYYSIKLSEIEAIDVRGRNFTVFSFRSSPGKLFVAGIGLIAIDQLNQVVIRDEPAGLSTGVAIVSGSLIASSFLLRAIQKKVFRPGGKSVMEIIDYTEIRNSAPAGDF
ncbi:hypothetical protein [Fulvivirga sedimenti]|uniref:Uncharacterized protein n=1 Tax=Fulvivirga sedimenti TaxID=2879465 RepID=A0A9X1HU89_9BACT|nr:hypothetical protein [Fulvivirga sedimenti]MCA6078030.1 hypothetical protein [Fulvivirga sedimenti]